MTDIEKHINNSKGRVYTNKISVVLYDPTNRVNYFILMINKRADECMLMVSPTKETGYICELYAPMISQLNMYYSHCIILEKHKFIGQHYKDVMDILESKYLNHNK